MNSTSPTIGVIGIGAMGMGIAKNLHRKGWPIVVRDIRPEAEAEAASLGMRVAATPAALAGQADCIIIVVVNAAQIDDVLFGSGSVIQAAAKGKTVVLCSTIAPEDTMRFSGRLAEAGVAAIDAPISGGPAKAEAGSMSMMIAAPEAVLQPWQPLLEAMAAKRFHISDHVGDGAKTKLVNNLLAGINLVASAEAFALGKRIGLEPRKLFDVIAASSGSSWVFEDRMSRVLENDFEPRAFAHILTKDVGLATAMADAAGYDTPLGDAALARYKLTLERGWSQLDDAAVIKTYES
ncbi:3-hydroxyisobutyrate dehydrogenase [Noviherbaspirillum humi]|uniref:3-hydroxyisobutyrate dehydrogenase n=1 Tax=Noviherbaspirillum humi TaxID=1688639 RepID=A0A239LK77_9BURK|nr:NAD(P)-dependent oxidoreductase [Noviherbaspirillum humi]SNT30213.1 3-hydroxyisobutyrate dehydrogenase [Noviherbaspirillum humi]